MLNSGQVKQLAHKFPEILAIGSPMPEQTGPGTPRRERENDKPNVMTF